MSTVISRSTGHRLESLGEEQTSKKAKPAKHKNISLFCLLCVYAFQMLCMFCQHKSAKFQSITIRSISNNCVSYKNAATQFRQGVLSLALVGKHSIKYEFLSALCLCVYFESVVLCLELCFVWVLFGLRCVLFLMVFYATEFRPFMQLNLITRSV